MDTPYVDLDKAFQEASGHLTKHEWKVFASIANHADSQGVAYISQKLIARDIGEKTCSHVSKSVRNLEEHGYLSIRKISNGTIHCNEYHISSRFLRKIAASENDARRLARLGEVAADVIKNIFALYEKASKIHNTLTDEEEK